MAQLRICKYNDNCPRCKYYSICSDGGSVCHAPLGLTDGKPLYRLIDKLGMFWFPKSNGGNK